MIVEIVPRRPLLRAFGIAITAGIKGCNGLFADDTDGTPTTGPGLTETPPTTPKTTLTRTPTTGPETAETSQPVRNERVGTPSLECDNWRASL
jgi:hypothetical protein